MSIIKLKNINFSYGNKSIIEDLTLEFEERKTTYILGNSGSGKTTILRLIAGLEIPREGKIYIENELVSTKNFLVISPEKRKLGYIFQDLALWPHFSVYKNISFGLKERGEENIDRKVMEILDFFGIEDHANKFPHQLSGGQQQMVAISRALVLKPKILLMDEPLANLDVRAKKKILNHLNILRERYDLTIIYVTHDHKEAFDMADNLVVINNGNIEDSGSIKEIKNSKNKFVKDIIDYL